MIAKKAADRASGSMEGLIGYLTNSKGNRDRVGRITITNCEIGEEDRHNPDLLGQALTEIAATQAMNTRAKTDKTYHLILSFPAGERPTDEQLAVMEEEFCKALGMEKHQRISIQHEDTENFHVHIAINRVDPETFRLKNERGDFRKLLETRRALEERFNLKPNEDERKRENERETERERNERKRDEKERDFESKTGKESFIRYMKELAPAIRAANSWKELHARLAAKGVELRKRGAGLVFVSGDGYCKASTIDRAFSLKRLEERLGPFEPGAYPPRGKGYRDTPLAKDADTARRFKRYQEWKADKTARQIKMREEVKKKTEQIYEESRLITNAIAGEEMSEEIRALLIALTKMFAARAKKIAAENAKRKLNKQNSFRYYAEEERKEEAADRERAARIRAIKTAPDTAGKIAAFLRGRRELTVTMTAAMRKVYERTKQAVKYMRIVAEIPPKAIIARQYMRELYKRIVADHQRSR